MDNIISLTEIIEAEKENNRFAELPDFFYECLEFFEEEGYTIYELSPANSNKKKRRKLE